MVNYFLGIITGLVVSVVIILADLAFKRRVNPQGITASLTKRTHPQAEICEPLSEELEDFIGKLKKE